MRLLIAVPILAGLALPAQAEGALAVAIHEKGLREGFAYAWHLRAATKEDARKEALAECGLQAKMNGVNPLRCKVTEVFSKQCIAAAFDPQSRSAGWGVGRNEEAARILAIKRCREKGTAACHISDLDCDK